MISKHNNYCITKMTLPPPPPPKKEGSIFKKEAFHDNSKAVGSTGKNSPPVQNNEKIPKYPNHNQL